MDKTIDIIYSRVSREDETLQDLEVQEQKLIEKFNLENAKILKERGSAYDLNKLKNRKKFIKLCKYIFKGYTIMDVFFQKYEKKKVRIFVWDSHRLMRNIFYALYFLLMCDLFGVEIYTYQEGKLKSEESETPSKKLVRYVMFLIHAYSGEEYSYTVSRNIKKAFVNLEGIFYSKKGKKVGRNFRTAEGEKVNVPFDTLKKINRAITYLHKKYAEQGKKYYYAELIERIKKKYDVTVSKSYVSRLRPGRKDE